MRIVGHPVLIYPDCGTPFSDISGLCRYNRIVGLPVLIYPDCWTPCSNICGLWDTLIYYIRIVGHPVLIYPYCGTTYSNIFGFWDTLFYHILIWDTLSLSGLKPTLWYYIFLSRVIQYLINNSNAAYILISNITTI